MTFDPLFQEVDEFNDPRTLPQSIEADLYSRRIYCSRFGYQACKPYIHYRYDRYISSTNEMRGFRSPTLCVVDQPPDFIRQLGAGLALSGIERVELLNTVTNVWEIMTLQQFLKIF